MQGIFSILPTGRSPVARLLLRVALAYRQPAQCLGLPGYRMSSGAAPAHSRI